MEGTGGPLMAKILTIDRCPDHGFWAICVDDGDGGGTRVTPSKCCGRWDREHAWKLSARFWRELAELATIAADEAEKAAR
jgi:hypothetical protein